MDNKFIYDALCVVYIFIYTIWPYLAFTPHLFQLADCCQPQVFKIMKLA